MKEGPPSSGRGRLRLLSDEDIELWLSVTRSVSPRPGSKTPARSAAMLHRKKIIEPAAAEPPVSHPAVHAHPSLPGLAQLDPRLRQKLARGRTDVDAVIDLHGMRQQEAHAALHGFLQRTQREGAKVILVVTGKGQALDEAGFETSGVLRRSVPHWLRAPEWRGLVVGFEEAARNHGGTGALYVRLRRRDRGIGKLQGKSGGKGGGM
jgi:DNA-nicking Smr family endonuclease